MSKLSDSIFDFRFIPLATAKAKLSELVRVLVSKGGQIVVTNRGTPEVVILRYDDFLKFLKVQEAPKSPPRRINFDEWMKKRPERLKIVKEIDRLFEGIKLTRKPKRPTKAKMLKKMGLDKP